MDIATVAATAVMTLLPYLAKTGETVSRKLGEDLYQFLKTYFQKNNSAKEALKDLRDDPKDTDLQGALRVQLKKSLRKDKEFAKELNRILDGVKDSGGVVNVVYGNPQKFNQFRDNDGIIINK